MDQKNFAIGVLSTTAAIMLVGLVLIGSQPATVDAAGMTASGGEYIMTIGTTPQTDEEYLYVIDTGMQKMLVYRFDANKAAVDMVQGIDLSQFRQTTGQPPAGRPQPPPRKP